MNLTEAKPSLSKLLQTYRRNEIPTLTESADKNWFVYGSNIASYDEDFKDVLDGNTVTDLLKNRPSPIVLDLMASSDTLADLFNGLKTGPKIGIAVSLADIRGDEQKERDRKLGITQISGDLTHSSIWKKINQTLGGKKIDLIMERGVGSMNRFPQNEKLFTILLTKMWRMLDRNSGTMIIETIGPRCPGFDPNIRLFEWIETIQQSEILAKIGYSPENTNHLFIKIVKTPDSPHELPQLLHQ